MEELVTAALGGVDDRLLLDVMRQLPRAAFVPLDLPAPPSPSGSQSVMGEQHPTLRTLAGNPRCVGCSDSEIGLSR